MHTLFFYGTLMKGQSNYRRYLSQSVYLGEGEITGYAIYAVSSYPGIVAEDGESVKGEVFTVDPETLRKIDHLEGEGCLYLRKQVDVLLNEKIVQGYAFIWNHPILGIEKVGFDKQPWKAEG